MIRIPHNILARVVRFVKQEPPPQVRDVNIGGVIVGRGRPVFFVAEIGINHNGSLEIAKKLIDVAAQAGAQAVKFQKRTVPVVYSQEELAKPRVVDRAVLENAVKRNVLPQESVERLLRTDFKETTNGDLKWALEFNKDEYAELFAYAGEKGLLCFASPWDEGSVDFLEQFDPPCHKIASAMITDYGLLRKVKETGRPIIASTGMCTMEQVQAAVSALSGAPLVLLHTISTYPATSEEINWRTIAKLKKAFPEIPVGYSGHEQGVAISIAAVATGAHLIERHLTLDKKMFGTDQAASLEPQEFAQLVKSIKEVQASVGDGVKRILPSEIPIMNKLRRKSDF